MTASPKYKNTVSSDQLDGGHFYDILALRFCAVEELGKLHSDRLRVKFDGSEEDADQKIDMLTPAITRIFREAESKLKAVSSQQQRALTAAEVKVRKNVQRCGENGCIILCLVIFLLVSGLWHYNCSNCLKTFVRARRSICRDWSSRRRIRPGLKISLESKIADLQTSR